ncbi:hypothetical protein AAFF_G00044130 [Aldrovandia affinis]|uniref:Uncharacterized protein n=1 Tax=Aldrovandia affinis TaxID=143900 RepID=A0AAD7S2B7_9TELE|nr:hypothetical protein AAFF_G00044130 [Aldrovandia affinis]
MLSAHFCQTQLCARANSLTPERGFAGLLALRVGVGGGGGTDAAAEGATGSVANGHTGAVMSQETDKGGEKSTAQELTSTCAPARARQSGTGTATLRAGGERSARSLRLTAPPPWARPQGRRPRRELGTLRKPQPGPGPSPHSCTAVVRTQPPVPDGTPRPTAAMETRRRLERERAAPVHITHTAPARLTPHVRWKRRAWYSRGLASSLATYHSLRLIVLSGGAVTGGPKVQGPGASLGYGWSPAPRSQDMGGTKPPPSGRPASGAERGFNGPTGWYW